MSRKTSRAESWSTVYKAFQNINFSSYDFLTIKRSLIDYIKLYHSENFNDYIENSEIIALIESFSYVAEILAYRQDMNAHENFLGLAERKDSVLQLAKFISYNASRNLPARGLVKITSVQTTQSVMDNKGNSLANKKITWSDTNNTDWKDQFFIVMNLILQQEYGTVSPKDRVQVDDVLFELYRLDNNPLNNGVITYNASSNGESYPMELVPVSLDVGGPYERRPSSRNTFSLLYGSDGLGDSSNSTGFFCFSKQGTLNRIRKQYDGITPNQTTVIGDRNINNTDVWINNVDAETGATFTSEIVDNLGRRLGPSGEWVPVDIANIENVIFNTNLNRNKYEIETLDNDDVKIIFGDGEFADVPGGMFDIWYRTSTAGSSVILQNSVINKTASFTYIDHLAKVQTLTFTFSLTGSLVNGAPTEDIERIRRFAPAVYYTQDRMVNGRDYNSYPLQNQSVTKVRAVNRTFSGDSQYLSWHDPSNYYEDVKIFGDDLSLCYKTIDINQELSNVNPRSVINLAIQPKLTDVGLYVYHTIKALPIPNRTFTSQEIGTLDVQSDNTILGEMQKGLANPGSNFTLYIRYEAINIANQYRWITYNAESADFDVSIKADSTFKVEYYQSKWTVINQATEIVSYSPTTKFWFNNSDKKVVVHDTLNVKYDNIVLLSANINATGNGILNQNVNLNVIDNTSATLLPNTGLTDENSLSVIPPDLDDDGIPDDLHLGNIVRGPNTTATQVKTTAKFMVLVTGSAKCGLDELTVKVNGFQFSAAQSIDTPIGENPFKYYELKTNNVNQVATRGEQVVALMFELKTIVGTNLTNIQQKFNRFIESAVDYAIVVDTQNYAYFEKDGEEGGRPITPSELDRARAQYAGGISNYTRYLGRNALNFAWFHRTPRYHLIDPCPTNIIDMFIITRAYYEETRRWLRGVAQQPELPTALELRTSYQQILESRMISDTVIPHPGKFKILFGQHADTNLKATFKVIKSTTGQFTDNELKVRVMEVIRNFFEIDQWEFGETFYGTELIAAIHASLPGEIDSVVIVPDAATHLFGELFEIVPKEDELFQASVNVSNIEIVDHFNSRVLKQGH